MAIDFAPPAAPASLPSAASDMQAAITETNPAPPASPETPQAPVTTPPAAPAAEQSQGQPGEQSVQAPNWYEKLLAQDQNPVSDLQALINPESFQALAQNPQGLAEWAQKAHGHLSKFHASSEREQKLTQAADYAGGWDAAEPAFQIYGDLFRGDDRLTEEERSQFQGATTYADRGLQRIMSRDRHAAYELGTSVLNQMPDLLKANRDYVLYTLGLDPRYADDFKKVVDAGGFKPTEDQSTINEWFKVNNVPTDQLASFNRLPLPVQKDILAGDPNAAKFHLQRYHNDFQNEDRQAKYAENQRIEGLKQVEIKSNRSLNMEMHSVWNDYTQKGIGLGLDPLAAAGAAALAAAELDKAYWEEKENDTQKAINGWHGKIKTGNQLQMDGGRSGYRKLFEDAWRRALQGAAGNRPGVPANAPKNGGAPPPPPPPPGSPETPQPGAPQRLMSAAEEMEMILRSSGIPGLTR